jgi:PPM family protein phosphatase
MLEAFGITDPGCVRTNNEDYFLIDPHLGLYLVADGMGGAQAGEHASRITADTVAAQIRQAASLSPEALVSAVHAANSAVMDAAASNARLEGMGTTVVAALDCPAVNGAADHNLSIVSVGDSRAYLFDGAVVTEVTDDQTWVNEIGRKLGLDDQQLRTHPMRHVLTMAVGVSSPLRVNRYSLKMSAGMEVLLCSDGLHGVVPQSEIDRLLQDNASTLESKCRNLIQSAIARGAPDNVTVLILRSV